MDVLYRCGSLTIGRLTAVADQEKLLSLFCTVAEEQGWEVGDSLDRPHEQSLYFAAFCSRTLAGGIELRSPDPFGTLPICSTWPELIPQAEESVAHVVALALAREFRAQPKLLWTLSTELWRACRSLGFENLLLEATPRNYRIYQRLGWALEIIGPERLHWGELCFPCQINLDRLEQSVRAKVQRDPSLAFITDQADR